MNTSHATVRVTRAGTAVIAGVLAFMLAAVTLAISTASAAEGQKVWVCKYVTKPGGDEVLQGARTPSRCPATPRSARSSTTPRAGPT